MVRFSIFAYLLWFTFQCSGQAKAHKKVLQLMGSRFEITAVATDEGQAWRGINAAIEEITRIEKLISSWDEHSETTQINQNAGIKPVKVDKELFNLIERALKISDLTDGAFDVSYASLDKIWKYDGTMSGLPSASEVAGSVAKINYHNVVLNTEDCTVFLRERGMKIGFGAIGKGYAANKGREKMIEMGIISGVVNAGGDLITWGKEEDGSAWSVGIANPKNKQQVLGWLQVGKMAVVTSGNYEKFVVLEGKRYSHIIDPRTGYPVQGLKSVTIICPDAELADALATSVFVMGKKNGLALIDQLNSIECLLVDDNDELFYSKNLKLNYYTNRNQSAIDSPQLKIGHENK